MKNYYIHESAEVSDNAKIGNGVKIWNLVQIREGVVIGENTIIGKNVYIDYKVKIGKNVKIQNNVSIFHGVTVEDGVFIGPGVCFTNDKYPRAINEDGTLKSEDDWIHSETLIKNGASIGAGSIILPGITIGKFAMIGAGSTVPGIVEDHAIVFGNPAKKSGYVCFCGKKLSINSNKFFCESCKKYISIKS